MTPSSAIASSSARTVAGSPFLRLLGACTLALAGCCSSPAEDDVEPKTLVTGHQSAIESASTEVLRTPEQWQAWWGRHAAGGLEPREAPAVDWSRDMVVAVTLGERPSLGYGVELESAVRDEGVVRLVFRERAPAPGTMQGQVVTHPFACVVLPRSEVEVSVE